MRRRQFFAAAVSAALIPLGSSFSKENDEQIERIKSEIDQFIAANNDLFGSELSGRGTLILPLKITGL